MFSLSSSGLAVKLLMLKFLREHLNAVVLSEYPLISDTNPNYHRAPAHRWMKKLQELQASCRNIILDGGSDYDRSTCNPATLAGLPSILRANTHTKHA